ncbi:MAG: TolC family protein [Cyanobacteriota bacterium]|nr:TolC family protein [Cyanobacteriota bacterium]
MGRSRHFCSALLIASTGFGGAFHAVLAAAPPQSASPVNSAPQPAAAESGSAAPPTLPTPPVAPAQRILPLLPSQELPLAPAVKGPRPLSNPKVLPPAATQLPLQGVDLGAPAPLALPSKPQEVRIEELRPLSLNESETIAEVNSPDLKALASQVEQAQSGLRAEIARWYPTLSLNANSFPATQTGQNYNRVSPLSAAQSGASGYTVQTITSLDATLQATWSLIDPRRVPSIALARDQYEKAKNAYLIGLRELRLQVAQAYFDLQSADEQVRIGQESVRASLVSLRDAQARFQAGVATKLEVLEAQTQLARDQQLLTQALYGRSAGSLSAGPGQAIARRILASLLDLPQNVTPTAKDPARVVGTWIPSLQESIIAAYTFREELDQILLDISIANSTANRELASVQPVLSLFNAFSVNRGTGSLYTPGLSSNFPDPSTDAGFSLENQPQRQWSVNNTFGLNVTWSIFDGGRAKALYRQSKQKAQENTFNFSKRRDEIRQEVEVSFYDLLTNNRNILTTSNEVLSARESLRLARLRFQAGVTTQREVVDTQRDLTQAEVRYSSAIANYNKSLAELRRRTGLDLIALCQRPTLPARRPSNTASDVPIEPTPLLPACQAGGSKPVVGR